MALPANRAQDGQALFDLTAASGAWEDLDYGLILEHFTASLGHKIQDYLGTHGHELGPVGAAMLLFMRNRYQDSLGTMATYANNLCLFFNEIRLPFHLVSRYDVENYLLQLKDRGRKTTTINTKLATLRSFFEFLANEELVQHDPAKPFKTRRAKALSGHQTKVLGLEEVQALLGYAKAHGTLRNYVMLALMFFTGVRAQEITRLCWNDLARSVATTGDRGWHARVRGKGSKERTVYLPPWLVDRLMKYRFAEYRVQPFAPAPSLAALPVFPNMRNVAKPLTTRAVYKIVREHGLLALGREISPHWGRHSFTTNARLRGATWDDLQAQLGHESITTTMRYQHSQHLKESAAGEVFDNIPSESL
jgi:integrase/recombinase XerC